MAEWLKAAVSKTAILSNRDRGFESHPLRHYNQFEPLFKLYSHSKKKMFFNFFNFNPFYIRHLLNFGLTTDTQT